MEYKITYCLFIFLIFFIKEGVNCSGNRTKEQNYDETSYLELIEEEVQPRCTPQTLHSAISILRGKAYSFKYHVKYRNAYNNLLEQAQQLNTFTQEFYDF
jgi:hypothetical protein